MTSNRLEAFSDGVIAIIITIMVLELSVPSIHSVNGAGNDTLSALWDLRFVFVSYVLSFAYLAIYWNNHHHMLFVTERVSGGVLWANMHLLFWLSLIPFVTAWMGENDFASTPTAVYGAVLLMDAVAYFILQRSIIHSQGDDSLLARAVGADLKGKVSPILYAIAIPAALWQPWVSYAIFVAVAVWWIVPDLRIERAVEEEEEQAEAHEEVAEKRRAAGRSAR